MTPLPTTNEDRADRVLAMLGDASERGYIGEPVSQLEHALQCAQSALDRGADDEVVLGALFHDLGHLVDLTAPNMDGLGVIDHERAGAEFLLELGFSPRVAALVQHHVAAKRYLCGAKPAYLARISAASKKTLSWQGGPMSEAERAAFERLEHFRDILAVRAWDDLAKDPSRATASLSSYRALIVRHLDQHGGAPAAAAATEKEISRC